MTKTKEATIKFNSDRNYKSLVTHYHYAGKGNSSRFWIGCPKVIHDISALDCYICMDNKTNSNGAIELKIGVDKIYDLYPFEKLFIKTSRVYKLLSKYFKTINKTPSFCSVYTNIVFTDRHPKGNSKLEYTTIIYNKEELSFYPRNSNRPIILIRSERTIIRLFVEFYTKLAKIIDGVEANSSDVVQQVTDQAKSKDVYLEEAVELQSTNSTSPITDLEDIVQKACNNSLSDINSKINEINNKIKEILTMVNKIGENTSITTQIMKLPSGRRSGVNGNCLSIYVTESDNYQSANIKLFDIDGLCVTPEFTVDIEDIHHNGYYMIPVNDPSVFGPEYHNYDILIVIDQIVTDIPISRTNIVFTSPSDEREIKVIEGYPNTKRISEFLDTWMKLRNK